MRRASKSHRPLAVAVGEGVAWRGTMHRAEGKHGPANPCTRRSRLPSTRSGAEQRGVNRSFPIQPRETCGKPRPGF